MKNLSLVTVLILFTGSFLGCTHLAIGRGDHLSETASNQREIKIHGFVLGAVQNNSIDSNTLCAGSKAETFDLIMKPLDVLISAATFGIYFPQTLRFTCKEM
jgi:hypothetical protein